ncbi:MAG: EAL domain-containing protein [Burkholderiales bacterium]
MLKHLVEQMGTANGDDRSRVAAYVLAALKDAALTTDAGGRIIYLNPSAERLTGWRSAETRGINSARVIRLVNPATREPICNPVEQALKHARTVPFETGAALVCRSGKDFAVTGHVAPIVNSHARTSGTLVILHDTSHPREAPRQVPLEHYDPLTGLVAKHEFERRLDRAIASAMNEGLQHALCHADLSGFKVVNDQCGHLAGDELLREIAELLRLRVCQRDSDTLARLAGDEFALLLEACPVERACKIGYDVLAAIKDFRFTWRGASYRVGASVGVTALAPRSETAANMLSAFAAACYAAKEVGRNRLKIFDTSDLELALRRGEMRWVNQVSEALLEDRLTLFAQPFFALRSSGKAHSEILVRMIGSGNQLIPPLRFLPTAERYNLMPHLDRWVIANAFEAYRRVGKGGVWTINIAASTLESAGIVQFVRKQSEKHKVPPQAICFEIPESAALTNLAQALDFFWALKGDGFRFALDHVGAETGSLSNLKSLPVDFLKIDSGLAEENARTLEVICRVSEVLGVQTVAECVESEAVLSQLKKLGVDYVQGNVCARPAPLEIEEMRSKRRR